MESDNRNYQESDDGTSDSTALVSDPNACRILQVLLTAVLSLLLSVHGEGKEESFLELKNG